LGVDGLAALWAFVALGVYWRAGEVELAFSAELASANDASSPGEYEQEHAESE